MGNNILEMEYYYDYNFNNWFNNTNETKWVLKHT